MRQRFPTEWKLRLDACDKRAKTAYYCEQQGVQTSVSLPPNASTSTTAMQGEIPSEPRIWSRVKAWFVS